MVDNECEDSSDCNLNGDCTEGKCECDKIYGVTYLGTHCEIKMTDECKTIHHGKRPECVSYKSISLLTRGSFSRGRRFSLDRCRVACRVPCAV